MKRYVLVAAILALTWSAFDYGLASWSQFDLGVGVRPAAADDDDDDDGGDDDDGDAEQIADDDAAAATGDDEFDDDDFDEDDDVDDDDFDEDDDDDDDDDDDENEDNGDDDDGEDDDDVSSEPSADLIDDEEGVKDTSEAESGGPVRIETLTTTLPEDDGLIEAGEILAFAPDATSLDQIEALGFSVATRESLPALGIEIAQIISGAERDLEDVLAELRAAVPDITFEANHIYSLAGNICEGNGCYGTDLIGWSGDRASCGGGIRIGLIDSGVDTAETALKSSQVRQQSFLEDRLPAPSDHGTAIAALLVASDGETFTGLLPEAELLVAAAFYQQPDGTIRANALALARSLNWLVGERASVINFSLTGPPNGLLELSIARAHAAGAIIVAAAGNGGPSGPSLYPGAYDQALAITAVDRYLRIYRHANRGGYLFAAAPGVGIWAPTGGPNGRAWDGTSFASVFAAAILAEQAAHDAKPGDIAKAIARDARDLGAPGRDNVYGWGLMASRPGCLP